MFDLDVTILTAGDAYSIVMGRDETSILPTDSVSDGGSSWRFGLRADIATGLCWLTPGD